MCPFVKGITNNNSATSVTNADNVQEDINRLFELPLAEFTAARNALATRLKKAGRSDDAERVKSLAKPPVSAWAVNQLYWRHREAFDALIAAGKQLRTAYTLQLTKKPADTHGPSAARREALAKLLHWADLLLREAGHTPTPETMRRITTSLEAMSAAESKAGVPAGRLTQDVSPLGFELFAGLVPEIGRVKPRKDAPAHNDAAARARREAEERLQKAVDAADEARQRVDSLTAELERERRLLADAERRVEKAREDLRERQPS
jgi:hypothetical protein